MYRAETRSQFIIVPIVDGPECIRTSARRLCNAEAQYFYYFLPDEFTKLPPTVLGRTPKKINLFKRETATLVSFPVGPRKGESGVLFV